MPMMLDSQVAHYTCPSLHMAGEAVHYVWCQAIAKGNTQMPPVWNILQLFHVGEKAHFGLWLLPQRERICRSL